MPNPIYKNPNQPEPSFKEWPKKVPAGDDAAAREDDEDHAGEGLTCRG